MNEKLGLLVSDFTDLEPINLVPIGEENAISGRLIWKRYELWSLAGLRDKLNMMASEGLIERKKVEPRQR